jgi:hypothetical protein
MGEMKMENTKVEPLRLIIIGKAFQKKIVTGAGASGLLWQVPQHSA